MRYPKVATKDIDVYKNVKIVQIREHLSKINTPFRSVEIPTLPYKLVAEGEEIIKRCEGCKRSEGCKIYDCLDVYKVYGGFIHAYKDMEFALRNCYLITVVVKAIIPAGTPYFENEAEICAKEMYLQGIIYSNYHDLLEHIDPCIPILMFNTSTATFKQMNSPTEELIEESIKELEEVCV